MDASTTSRCAPNSDSPVCPRRPARREFGRRLGAACLALWAGCAAAGPALLYSPYKDVSLGVTAAEPLMAGLPPPEGRRWRVLTWAFATGECGAERWGDFDTVAFAKTNVATFERAGIDFIVATGGEAGIFSCGSDAGMERFVARYASPRLVGLDFDIEGKQTPGQIDSLVRRAKAAQAVRPQLRISFTLATHAGSDAAARSLNATGERVLQSIKAARFERAIVNLMVMNYGPADARWCVLRSAPGAPRCDMGRSALRAARNLHLKHGIPYQRIALTAMLGENDVEGNVFTPEDVQHLVQGARALGLQGVHHWSLDRDRPCGVRDARVSPRCHGLAGIDADQFDAAFGAALAAPPK